MISFRVSEREFETLKTLSESEGARSVSDFARLALCGRRVGAPEPTHLDPSLDQLRTEVVELKAYVRRVADMLEQTHVSAPRPTPLATDQKTRGI